MHKVCGLASDARKVGAVGQDKIVGGVENALGDHETFIPPNSHLSLSRLEIGVVFGRWASHT